MAIQEIKVDSPTGAASGHEEECDEECDDPQWSNVDCLVDWWIRSTLSDMLEELSQLPEAAAFLKASGKRANPGAAQQKGRPDESTVRGILEAGGYDDADGFINPDIFWEDLDLHYKSSLAAGQRPQTQGKDSMSSGADVPEVQKKLQSLEHRFWSDLLEFERSMTLMDPTLASLFVSLSGMESVARAAARAASETSQRFVQNIQDMIRSFFFWSSEATERTDRPKFMQLPRHLDVRQYFHRIMELYCEEFDSESFVEDMKAVDKKFLKALRRQARDWKEEFDQAEDDHFEASASAFPGHADKVSLETLLPKPAATRNDPEPAASSRRPPRSRSHPVAVPKTHPETAVNGHPLEDPEAPGEVSGVRRLLWDESGTGESLTSVLRRGPEQPVYF